MEDNYLLTDLLEIPKLSSSKNDDKLYNWLKFIKGESREEMISMAMADRDIDKAFHILKNISESKEERAAYLSREMALHDEATKLYEAKSEGKIIGIAGGIIYTVQCIVSKI